MDKVQILEKHLKLMIKRTKQSYVTIEQMRETPEYEAVLNALTEIETDIVKNNAVLPIVTNCYRLNEIEYARMKELKSNTVKLTGGSGIGIGVDCLDDKGKWIDITDYNCW